MKILLLLGFLLSTSHAIGQAENDKPARDSFTLSMPVSKETYYESHIQSSPYIVGPKVLQLYPGETVYIEVDQQDGLITGIRSVKKNINKDKTLEISFKQTVSNEEHSNMILNVKNPFKKDLSYEAIIRIMKTGKWISTSIIPVKAGLLGIEVWPDVIISIGLSGWKFLDE